MKNGSKESTKKKVRYFLLRFNSNSPAGNAGVGVVRLIFTKHYIGISSYSRGVTYA